MPRSNSEVYAKWSQAMASADTLTGLHCNEADDLTTRVYTLVIPIVVVPDGRLWRVHYDHTGKRLNVPLQIDRCPYYVGQTFHHSFNDWRFSVTLSHLEFVTVSGLTRLILEIIRGKGFGPTVQRVIEGRVKGGSVGS